MFLQEFTLWDVASVTTYGIIRMYVGVRHAWPIVVTVALACSLDRDMEFHEMVHMLYMLRKTCGSVHLHGSVGYMMCTVLLSVCIWSRSLNYASRGHVIRRATVSVAIFLSILVHYDWNDNHLFSVARLLVYIVLTRASLCSPNTFDTWDVAVQNMWLFVVPSYAYLFLLLQVIGYHVFPSASGRIAADATSLV